MDMRKINVLGTGTLIMTNGTYQIVQLGPKHIEHLLALQNDVQTALPEDHKAFLLPRSREDFEGYFSRGDSIIGITHKGQLIAQGAMALPTAQDPVTGIDVKLHVPPEKIAVLQGMMVDPLFRGNKFLDILIHTQFDLAYQWGRAHVLSAIDVRNRFSLMPALAAGFEIHTISDKTLKYGLMTTVYGLYAPLERLYLRRDFNQAATNAAVIEVAQSNIALQKQFLNAGYKGVAYSLANKTLDFQEVDRTQTVVDLSGRPPRENIRAELKIGSMR